MEALIENTSKRDQKMAKNFIEQLKGSEQAPKKNLVIKIDLGGQELPPIPVKAFSLLVKIMDNMAIGKFNAILLADELLTTQQAAEILNVSRPYLVKLLEEKEIPYTKTGSHRRVELKEILAYKEKMKTTRRKNLDYLTKESQNLNLY